MVFADSDITRVSSGPSPFRCFDTALQTTMTVGMAGATTSGTAEDTMVTSMATTIVVEQLQPLLLLEGVQLLQQLLLAKQKVLRHFSASQLLMPIQQSHALMICWKAASGFSN